MTTARKLNFRALGHLLTTSKSRLGRRVLRSLRDVIRRGMPSTPNSDSAPTSRFLLLVDEVAYYKGPSC
jgi:hypothetical protein